MQKIENIGDYLKQHDLKPSYQRIRIFKYLLNNKNHPTVDMIYKELVGETPTLSKTTVYNTLKLFSEKGIVLIINIEDNETRYDADTSLHGHFKCVVCSNVHDFLINKTDLSLKNIDDFEIDETHIYLKGKCNDCKK